MMFTRNSGSLRRPCWLVSQKKPSRIASSQVTSRNFPQMIPCSGRGGSYPDPKSLTSSSSLVSHPRDDEKPLSNHVFCESQLETKRVHDVEDCQRSRGATLSDREKKDKTRE